MEIHETVTTKQATISMTSVVVDEFVLNSPDNQNGSATVATPNEGETLTVTAAVPQLPVFGFLENQIVTPGKAATVHGRYDKYNVINNPA